VVKSLIQKLFCGESKVKDKTSAEKYKVRAQQAKPIIDKLHKWLEQNQPRLVGKTKLAEAATYLAKQWHKLTT
jgi:transposase